MPKKIVSHIREVLFKAHSGDNEQFEAIFSDKGRLIIEAPAGYGKTKTMVSKIAYILASGKLPYPKKIIALTFSVNAAYKIKKDVAEELPKLLESEGFNPASINERVFISNYHGFCRHVLKLYGYLIHENLKNIDTIRSIDDSKIETITNLKVGFSYEDAKELSDMSDAIKNVSWTYIKENGSSYLKHVKSHLLPNNYISFNAIILFTLELFKDYPKILEFYRRYFSLVIVDEFQDTNIISYTILVRLVSERTKALFIGDPLQRIYGFIGAVPKLMEIAKKKFAMQEIRLKTNHRFKDNLQMMLLDRNLRLNAENPTNPAISENVVIDLEVFKDQIQEAEWVCEKIQNIIQQDSSAKVAVLVRIRSPNVQQIINSLEKGGVEYFYGLYTDEDLPYINFHRECLNIFTRHIKGNDRITTLNLKRFYSKVEQAFEKQNLPIIRSVLELLSIFLARLRDHYYFLTNEDKILFILDTFENRALKQQMEYVKTNVILSTVHGSKGLEWDYVILPDMEQYVFPNYFGLCGSCNYKHNRTHGGYCQLIYDKSIERNFLEELSVFYVSVTRAKKNVFFSSSRKRFDYSGDEKNTYVSCLLSLPGIES